MEKQWNTLKNIEKHETYWIILKHIKKMSGSVALMGWSPFLPSPRAQTKHQRMNQNLLDWGTSGGLAPMLGTSTAGVSMPGPTPTVLALRWQRVKWHQMDQNGSIMGWYGVYKVENPDVLAMKSKTNIKIHQKTSKNIKYQNTSRIIKIHQNNSKYIKIYQNNSKYIKIYQNISK